MCAIWTDQDFEGKLGVPTCLKVLLTWFNAKTALKPQIPPEMKKTTKKSPSSRIKKKKRMRRLF